MKTTPNNNQDGSSNQLSQLTRANPIDTTRKSKALNTDNMYKIQFPKKETLGFEILSAPLDYFESPSSEKESLHSRILHLQEKYESYAKQTFLDDYGVA